MTGMVEKPPSPEETRCTACETEGPQLNNTLNRTKKACLFTFIRKQVRGQKTMAQITLHAVVEHDVHMTKVLFDGLVWVEYFP